jgi:CRISPR-associated protein Cmr1
MVESTIIKCRTLTPLLVHGADGATPEMRTSSIKGGLRYWFRAINCHLDSPHLYEEEGKLFGDTSQKSSVRIKVSTSEFSKHISSFEVLPHWSVKGRRSFKVDGILPGTDFTVKLIAPPQYLERVTTLFEVFSFLGGIGKRVRRGMGSFMVTEISGSTRSEDQGDDVANYIFHKIQSLSPHFKLSDRKIVNVYSGRKALYPWIKSIEFGENGFRDARDLIIKIGATTSQFKKTAPRAYEPSLGHASRGRFASPIYVSVTYKEGLYYPVITTLNTVPDKGREMIDRALQEEFKTQILG